MWSRVSGGFCSYNYMLCDPISSNSPSMMTLAAQRGKHTAPDSLSRPLNTEINAVLGSCCKATWCLLVIMLNFMVLVCVNELALHNRLERQIQADRSVHCFPNSHSQITVGHAEGLWDRSGATLRTHTGKTIHSLKGRERERGILVLLFSF